MCPLPSFAARRDATRERASVRFIRDFRAVDRASGRLARVNTPSAKRASLLKVLSVGGTRDTRAGGRAPFRTFLTTSLMSENVVRPMRDNEIEKTERITGECVSFDVPIIFTLRVCYSLAKGLRKHGRIARETERRSRTVKGPARGIIELHGNRVAPINATKIYKG